MTFYTAAVILTELIMVAMLLHVITYPGFTRQQKAWYVSTFAAIMFCAAAEFAVHCGFYDPGMKIPLTILTVIQFSVAPLLSVLFSGSLGLNKQGIVAFLFLEINLLIETVSAFFGNIFYFDESGYHRGDFFIIYEILYVFSLFYLIVAMIIVGRKFKQRDMFTIILILVILVAGIVPMTLFKVNITYLAVAICASLCYIYYNDLVQQDIKQKVLADQTKISEMQEHTILGLSNLIESRDLETGEHITRTSAYVKRLALKARDDGVYADILDDQFISRLYTMAPMHDIGKIIVSDSILKKPGRLTPEEFEEMKKHAEAGGKIIKDILNGITEEDYITFAADIAESHHERWDGRGYPKGLKGEEIPLSARIMAISDVYDALVSKRCYKEPMSSEEAFDIIEKGSGTHFDPNLVKVLLNHKEIFEENVSNK